MEAEQTIQYVPIEGSQLSGQVIQGEMQEEPAEGETYLEDHNYHHNIVEFDPNEAVYLTDIVTDK